MGEIKYLPKAKLVVGMFSSFEDLLEVVSEELSRHFGPIDYSSPLIPFTHTDYYKEEMGENLKRKFISFRELIDKERLPEIKLLTSEIEKKYTYEDGKRRKINIDPGYITAAKLVLATTKNQQHRIYLGKGIYAEVTLRFRSGKFGPWEWTYPDYRTNEYLSALEKIRALYVAQIRSLTKKEKEKE